MIWHLIIVDIVWFMFAFKSAQEEVAWSSPFREISEEYFPNNLKSELSRIAHRTGATYVITLAIGFGLFDAIWFGVFSGAIVTLISLFIYWLLFDITYAVNIDKPWWYLGDTASMDKWLKRLGPNSGKTKAFLCLGAIVVLHIIYLIL